PRIMYHGAQDLIRRVAQTQGVEATFFDAADPGALRSGLRPDTAMVWIESPINPTWDVIDIAAAAAAAHSVGAVLCIDSSVAPPVTTRALELGADIVFHSASKYLNGHSDVMAGVLITNSIDALWGEVIKTRNLTGGVLGAFEAWLLLRGLRTLFLRFARCSENAMAIAQHFEGHPCVEAVLYPGLESHPGHAINQASQPSADTPRHPLARDGARQEKRSGGSECRAGQIPSGAPHRSKQRAAGEAEKRAGKEEDRGDRIDQDKANRCPDTERQEHWLDRLPLEQVSVRQHPANTSSQQKQECEPSQRDAAERDAAERDAADHEVAVVRLPREHHRATAAKACDRATVRAARESDRCRGSCHHAREQVGHGRFRTAGPTRAH
ncbi:MAG TPA: PLP-dependent transferase, partial [Acetobacteraceae bacterium]|nr:PLP-dependent transferase [Acetobacteraceae bacterium]